MLMTLATLPLTVQAQTTAPTLAATQPPVLLLQATTQEATLAGHAAVWVDTQANMTLSDVRQQPFTTVTHFQSAGFTKAAYWFQLRVARAPDAPTRWRLAMGEPYLDDIQVWIESEGDAEKATRPPLPLRLGDHVPFSERPLSTRTPTVRLNLPDTQPQTVWIRVSSTSAMNFNATVWLPDELMSNETRFNLYQGAYFGMLIIVILIYGLLGTWLRDTGMLTYAGYVSTLVMLYLGINGHAQVMFPFASSATWANDALVGCGVVGGLVVMPLLWIQLLNMRTQFPRIHRLYQSISLGAVLLLPFVVTPYYRLVVALVNQVGILFAVLCLILVLLALCRKPSTPLKLYLLAFLATVIGCVINIAGVLGWIERTSLTVNAYQTASLVHIMVMNVGLAMRVRQIQRNEVLAEQRAVDHKRFVAMLSHEFRNPLASIDRATNLLQLKITTITDADKTRLSGIRSSVAKLGALVDSFLMSEALEEHRLTPVPVDQAVAPLLAGVMAAQGADLQRCVTLKVTPKNLRFALDAKLIDIAVNNLLGNALRYTAPSGMGDMGGSVTLFASLDDGDLLIAVFDKGPGLSATELTRLGQPYYRASTALGQQGTGLGYYFSRLIVQAHGGSISAVNRVPHGLVVTLRLPHAK